MKDERDGDEAPTIKHRGDDSEDKKVSEDQLLGKYLFKVRYLGYPAVWMANARADL